MPIEAAITGSVHARYERRTQSGRVRLALTVKVQTIQSDPAEALIHVSVFEPLLSKVSREAQIGELVYVVGKMRLNRAKSEHGTTNAPAPDGNACGGMGSGEGGDFGQARYPKDLPSLALDAGRAASVSRNTQSGIWNSQRTALAAGRNETFVLMADAMARGL